MRPFRTVLLAGLVIGSASLSVMAWAGSPQVHVINLQLPDGSIEQIRYTGDVMPQVVLAPELAPAGENPFAMLDRLSADMDRQAVQMMRAVDALVVAPMADPAALTAASARPASAGSQSFYFASSQSGACERTVQMISTGVGPARVTSHTSGDCGPQATPRRPVPATLPSALPPAPRPEMIRIDYAKPPAHTRGHKVHWRS